MVGTTKTWFSHTATSLTFCKEVSGSQLRGGLLARIPGTACNTITHLFSRNHSVSSRHLTGPHHKPTSATTAGAVGGRARAWHRPQAWLVSPQRAFREQRWAGPREMSESVGIGPHSQGGYSLVDGEVRYETCEGQCATRRGPERPVGGTQPKKASCSCQDSRGRREKGSLFCWRMECSSRQGVRVQGSQHGGHSAHFPGVLVPAAFNASPGLCTCCPPSCRLSCPLTC